MILKRIALLLALPAMLALPARAEAGVDTGSGAIGVYQLNIHRMENTWPDWINFIKWDPSAVTPDLILGQDFETLQEIEEFRFTISHSWWGFNTNYTYVYRQAGANYVVIFWRTSRFSSAKDRGWNGYGGDQSSSTCEPGANNAQAVQVRLWDTLAQKHVGAVSMKTPPKPTNECARMNMEKATDELNRNDATVGDWRGDLRLVGTDANAPDYANGAYECWWDRTVAADPGPCGTSPDLGWSDVVYDLCAGARACLDQHFTRLASRTRIDFLFAKRPATTAVSTNQKTLSQGDCTKFSDHCSVGAAVLY